MRRLTAFVCQVSDDGQPETVTDSSIGLVGKRIDKPNDFKNKQDMQNRNPY